MKASFLVLSLVVVCNGCDKSKEDIEGEAKVFTTKLGLHVTGVECVTRDSDANGYVTCTAFLGDGQELELECTLHRDENGCKRKR